MSWTTPRDWVTDEVVTSTILNTHVRDQLKILGAGASVTHNIAQSLTDNAFTTLAFNSERYDPDGFHSNAVNNSRLTVPTGLSGRYLCQGQITIGGNVASMELQLRINGSTVIARRGPYSIGVVDLDVDISSIYYLSAADYVEFRVFHNTGATRDVEVNASYSPVFSIQGLGGTT